MLLQSSSSYLGLVLAQVWQGEGRLRVDEVVVDVSVGGNKHQPTADTAQERGGPGLHTDKDMASEMVKTHFGGVRSGC